jgi:gas vesicle protein
LAGLVFGAVAWVTIGLLIAPTSGTGALDLVREGIAKGVDLIWWRVTHGVAEEG